MPGKHVEFDRDEALTLYLCGMSVTDLAQDYGVNRQTMYSFIKSCVGEVRAAGHGGGVPRSDTCSKGHSMDDAIVKKDGKRNCRTCRRASQREWKRKKYHEKKAKEKA